MATIGAVTCVERLVPTSDIFPPTSCSLEPVALSVAEIEVSVFLHCCSRFLSSFSGLYDLTLPCIILLLGDGTVFKSSIHLVLHGLQLCELFLRFGDCLL